MECPEGVRGKCCCLNLDIGIYNITLESIVCPHLDKKTGLCTDYENRAKYEWCLEGKEIFNRGALPEGCLYLVDHPEREKKPMRNVGDVLKELSFNDQRTLIGIINSKFAHKTFEDYIPHMIKRR